MELTKMAEDLTCSASIPGLDPQDHRNQVWYCMPTISVHLGAGGKRSRNSVFSATL